MTKHKIFIVFVMVSMIIVTVALISLLTTADTKKEENGATSLQEESRTDLSVIKPSFEQEGRWGVNDYGGGIFSGEIGNVAEIKPKEKENTIESLPSGDPTIVQDMIANGEQNSGYEYNLGPSPLWAEESNLSKDYHDLEVIARIESENQAEKIYLQKEEERKQKTIEQMSEVIWKDLIYEHTEKATVPYVLLESEMNEVEPNSVHQYSIGKPGEFMVKYLVQFFAEKVAESALKNTRYKAYILVDNNSGNLLSYQNGLILDEEGNIYNFEFLVEVNENKLDMELAKSDFEKYYVPILEELFNEKMSIYY